MSRQKRASLARNGVAMGIGGISGVSPTSVAVSIQVTKTRRETGHPALCQGMRRAAGSRIYNMIYFDDLG